MIAPIPLEQLRWTVGGFDVTCANCHTALYEPSPDQQLCHVCAYALGEDLIAIHAQIGQRAPKPRRARAKRAS